MLWRKIKLGKGLNIKESESCSVFMTSWTVACQAPLSMEFFRAEYWSRFEKNIFFVKLELRIR